MTYTSGGFLREDDGALATEASAAQASFTRNGLARSTATGRLITGLGAAGFYSNGWPSRTSNNSGILACVLYADLVAPRKTQNGMPLDNNGQVITVTRALAVVPLTYSGGFQRDANGALVVT